MRCLFDWALGLAVVLIAAPSLVLADTPPGPPAAAPLPPGADALALSIWSPGDKGEVTHLASGLVCPAGIGDFHRVSTRVYDGVGLDVSCGYQDGPTTLTVYAMRHPGRTVAQEMADAKRGVVEIDPSRHVTLLSEAKAADQGLDWATAVYDFGQATHSSVWIAALDDWFVEYRVTYPDAREAQVLSGLKTVDADVRASAGAHLDLCAKAPPPKRDGTQMASHAYPTLLILMAATLTHEVQVKSQTVAWCVEGSLGWDHKSMLFWRGVDPDGADARMDRLTLATYSPPPTMLLAPVGDSQQWQASAEQNGKGFIFGNFEGRSSMETAGALFEQLLDGKAKALGGYVVNGGSISVLAP